MTSSMRLGRVVGGALVAVVFSTFVATAADSQIDPEKLQSDFRLARQALEEGHSGIYRYAPKAELDQLFDETERSIDRPMTVVEFYRTIAPAVAAIKCGHTRFFLPSDIWQRITTSTRLLPLQVRVLDGKAWILYDFSGEAVTLAGDEIRSINGTSIQTILETLLAGTPGDGDIRTSRIQMITKGWNFPLQVEALTTMRSPYELTVWNPALQRERTVHVAGVELPRLEELFRTISRGNQSPPSKPGLEFRDKAQIAVMTIPAFTDYRDATGEKLLRDFLQESFTALTSNGTQRLIIDVRNNGGGNDVYGAMLASYLLEKPFRYYADLVTNSLEFSFQKYAETANWAEKATGPLPATLFERRTDGSYRFVKHPCLAVQEPSTPTFSGKVFVLVNGGSYSATSEFLSILHDQKRATLIGEESGGGYCGNTSGFSLGLLLPNTGIRINVSLVTYYLAVGDSRPAARGVRPDLPVTYTIDELLEAQDKELERAIQLAREP